MAKEKIIQSGQLTLPRLLFLGVAGLLIVLSVAGGGIWLTIGYWGITLGLCGLLILVAIDYGIKMDTVEYKSPAPTTVGAASFEALPSQPTTTTSSDLRPKRQAKRAAKRRR